MLLVRYDCPRCRSACWTSQTFVDKMGEKGQCGKCDDEDAVKPLLAVLAPLLEEQRDAEVKSLLDRAKAWQETTTYDLMVAGLSFTPEHPRWSDALKLLSGGRSGTRYESLVAEGKVSSIHLHRYPEKSWAWQIHISCEGSGFSGSEWYITHDEVKSAFS